MQPSEVLPDRKERLLYVTARGEGKVKVIDLATHTVVRELAVGTQPETLLLTPDGRTLDRFAARHPRPARVRRHSAP